MALKDLKSQLSNFRLPKKEPLDKKTIVDVSKTQNQTPLSVMVESAPKIPRSTTTTNKEGVNPRKMDNSSKFLGETIPQKMDNSEKFLGETNPQAMSLEERYLGQTTPTKFDNSEKFLGETNPTPANNQSQFLGETNPTPANNQSQFLGETNPTPANNQSQFLGETTQTPSNRESKFLGETTQTPSNRESKFLGETDPTKFDNTSNFVRFRNEKISSPFATEPNKMNLDGKFLGETTPTPSDKESKFLGETTPTPSDKESKFLGETTPTPINNTGQFLGETDKTPISQGDKDKGEATPSDFTFTGKLENEGKDFKEVNYFSDIHATGFTSKFGGVEATKFVGVNPNNTVFDTTTSKYGDFNMSVDGLSSAPGYGKFKLNKAQTGNTQRYNPNKKYYINTQLSNKSISELQEMRNSPSFLDEMYSKYNLKDDSFNTGLGLFRHPLILRGIQRKGISKGEPQSWGVLGVTFDDGLIRGGAITSTVRALIDVARIGSWFASVTGVLWGAKQFGMQRTNRFGKVWTPVGMLAAIGGQHIGLKPMRPGLVPLNDPTVKYGNVLNGYGVAENAGFLAKKAAALLVGYETLDIVYGKTVKGSNFEAGNSSIWKTDNKGGFNSTYGINLSGPSNHTRYVNTFENPEKTKAAETAKFKQKFNPLTATMTTKAAETDYTSLSDVYNSTGQAFNRDKTELAKKYNDENFNGGLGSGTGNRGSHTLNQNGSADNTKSAKELIQDYTTLSYGQIRKISNERVTGNTSNLSGNDFRSKNESEKIKTRAEKENWGTNNINTRVHFGNPGENPIESNKKTDRTEWWKTATDGTRYDKINAAPVGAKHIPDLVNVWFRPVGVDTDRMQFRGTVNGITDTFSPTWDSFKYNGRADQSYRYSSFERSLSFNLQVYATSRIEMVPIWQKLARLSTLTMPQYSTSPNGGYQGMLIEFRIGDLYRGELAFIESLSYTMSDETPWEISMLGSNEPIGELPMGVEVVFGLKILGKAEPRYGQLKVYGNNEE